MSLGRQLAAEFVGTALLLACVVGSGVMGTMLAEGNLAVALLANAGATAGALYVLITVFGPISGAHFNPAVTFVAMVERRLSPVAATAYVATQAVGAVTGVVAAHAMFALPLLQEGMHARNGAAQWLAEAIATFGLVLTIQLAARRRDAPVAALVAAWIFAAYWFTSSTSFANPAVTLARMLTDTFAGIRPIDVPGFIAAQAIGALAGALAARGWSVPAAVETRSHRPEN